MTVLDTLNRVFREFKRYTGDGLPGEPTGAPLPVGDPSSGVHSPKKSEIREAIGGVVDAAEVAADRAEQALADALAMIVPDSGVTFPKLADAVVQVDTEARDDTADNVLPTVKRVASMISDLGQSGFTIVPDCVGDGVADDTVAFRAACVTAMTLGAMVELDPTKIYNLATWTPLTTTAMLEMKCNGATIDGPGGTGNNAYFLWTAVGGFQIDGGKWTGWYGLFQRWNYKWASGEAGWSGISTNIGAQTDTLVDCKFTNNVVSGATGFVFSIGIRINEMLIEGNLFQSCSGGYVIRLGEKVIGEFDVSWRGIRVKRNRFLGVTAPTNSSVSAVLLYSGQGEVTDNRVQNVVGNGTGDAWGMYFQGADLVVSGNHVYYVSSTGTTTDITGISMKGAQDDSGGTVEQSGLSGKVFGNICRQIGGGGVHGTGFKLQSRRTQCFGNEASSCTYAGFAMDNLLSSQDQSVINNVAIACLHGVIITGNGSRYQVKDNSIYACDIGIYFAPGVYLTNTVISMIQITNNMVSNGSGIGLKFYFGASTNNIDVIGNLLACSVGINWVAGSTYPSPTNVRLLDNRADLSSTNTTGTAPAGITVR